MAGILDCSAVKLIGADEGPGLHALVLLILEMLLQGWDGRVQCYFAVSI